MTKKPVKWQNNRVASIGVFIIQGKKVLLVKHKPKAEHLTNTYGAPAGRLEEGEEKIDGAVRELQEETGLTVLKADLIHLPTVYEADILRKSGNVVHFVWDVFVTDKFTGSLKESEETVPEWVDIDKLSMLNLLPNTENAIREGLQLLQ